MSSSPALQPASVLSLNDLQVSMTLAVPTFSNGNVVGQHQDSYVSIFNESYLLERKEFDTSGKLLWQVRRELALYNESQVLPQSSTIVYQDGTMVTSLREYNNALEPLEERLYVDGVQQMCKIYSYDGEKLVNVDQTLYTVQGLFSRRQRDQLVSRDGTTFAKRQLFDKDGKVIADYPEVASEELITSGVCIEI